MPTWHIQSHGALQRNDANATYDATVEWGALKSTTTLMHKSGLSSESKDTNHSGTVTMYPTPEKEPSMESPSARYRRDTLHPRADPQILFEVGPTHTDPMDQGEEPNFNNSCNVFRNKSNEVYEHDLFTFSEAIAPSVVNLSSMTLTSSQLSLLEKGLDFAQHLESRIC